MDRSLSAGTELDGAAGGALRPHRNPVLPGSRTGAGGARGWLDPRWRGAPEALLGDPGAALEALAQLAPERWLRRVPGRGTFAWRTGPVQDAGQAHGQVVVKRFEGDLARDRWYRRLRGRGGASPARREAWNLRQLAAAGFAVPRALAWFEEPGRRGRSALVMQHLAHAEHLRALLGRAAVGETRARLEHLARLVARLHAAGWYHRDLYLEHVVVTGPGAGELALLDVGRARRERSPRERWFVKDLAALLCSAPESVCPRARLRFLVGYLDARGLLAPERRRAFQREVERKAARLAAHAPRFVDPGSAGAT